MVHITFDTSQVRLEDFFQDGYGGLHFEGVPWQRGYGVQYGSGIADIFRPAIRFLVPYIKDAVRALRKEGVDTGARILKDISQGSDVKEAIISEAKTGIKNLADKAIRRYQRGGKRKRQRSLKKPLFTGRSVSRSSLNKKKRKDSLGFY